MFFSVLATFAEFESDLNSLRTREGDGHRTGAWQAAGQAALVLGEAAARGPPHARTAAKPCPYGSRDPVEVTKLEQNAGSTRGERQVSGRELLIFQ